MNPPIHNWIREGRKYLDQNEKAKELGGKLQMAYKQPSTLKTLVGGPKNGTRGQGAGGRIDVDAGCDRYQKKCHACQTLPEGKTFESTNTRTK